MPLAATINAGPSGHIDRVVIDGRCRPVARDRVEVFVQLKSAADRLLEHVEIS
jgi:hypothetical protein